MKLRDIFASSTTVVRRVLHLLAQPGRVAHSRDGLVIQPYRGYGSPDELFILGRVVAQPTARSTIQPGALGDLRAILRRVRRRGVPHAVVTAQCGDARQRVLTDRQGYFRLCLRPTQPLPTDHVWQPVELTVVAPSGATATGTGSVLVPPPSARFVVISDIDDTVVLTGVANKLLMLWRLFAQGAQSRVAFPGVAAFYQALYRGPDGAACNPLLYVSRGPWSIYEILDTFFQHHAIPVGPVLVLRDWGLSLQHPWPRRAPAHKLAVIREMVQRYHALPFVLIGDSGQQDPELYTQIVREHPGRVLAIYIRNVSRDAQREQAIAQLAAEVVAAGSSLLLAADSFAMAEHAAAHELINPAALAAVLRERVVQQGAADLQPTHTVGGPQQTTTDAVSAGAVQAALATDPDSVTPPNVVIEADPAAGGRDEPA